MTAPMAEPFIDGWDGRLSVDGPAIPEPAGSVEWRQPDQADVDAIRELLDLMVNFSSNDQRARFLLSCNWMRDRDRRLRSARP